MPIDWSQFAIKKPSPGSRRRELRTKRSTIVTAQDKKKQAARRRDINACGGCRWPKADHPNGYCEGPLDVAHGRAIGQGGDKTLTAERTQVGDLLLVCRVIHGSIEAHERRWIGNTNGKLQFEHEGVLVGEETRIGVIRHA